MEETDVCKTAFCIVILMTKGAAIILTAAVGCTISPFLRGVAMGSDGYGGWGMEMGMR